MASKIKLILILVIILGGILFIFRSGIFSQLGSSFGSINLWPTPSSSAPWYAATSTRFTPSVSVGGMPWYLASSSQPISNKTAQDWINAINTSDIPQGFTLKDLSPYFHKVRISSVSPGGGYFGSYGQLSLSVNSNDAGTSINVSGWFLRGNKGSQYVPQAVSIYDPSGLSVESDIYLGNGDILNMYTSRSAIGENIRLNKCIGYLQNANNFVPALPMSCPYINRSDVAGFSGQCQNYVTSIGSCAAPAANPPVPESDYGCRAFINNLNYKGCFDTHRSDSDFLSHEWRAWIGNTFLDTSHDRLLLLDRQGLLVDLYQY